MKLGIFDVYINETHAVIDNWGKYNFNEDMLGEVHGDLVYLAETAPVRLGELRMRRKND